MFWEEAAARFDSSLLMGKPSRPQMVPEHSTVGGCQQLWAVLLQSMPGPCSTSSSTLLSVAMVKQINSTTSNDNYDYDNNNTTYSINPSALCGLKLLVQWLGATP